MHREPPLELYHLIISKIKAKEQRRLKWHFGIMGFLSAISFISLVPSLGLLGSNLSQSGFYQYLSLAFSDGGILLNSWQEFSLLIMESLPVVSLVICLAIILVFLWSFIKAFKNYQLLWI